MTDRIYSAVQYDQIERPEPWQEPRGLRRLIWKLRGSKRPPEPFNYYDSLRLAFNAVVSEMECRGVVPVGSIRVEHNFDVNYLTDRVVVDMNVEGNRVWAPWPYSRGGAA